MNEEPSVPSGEPIGVEALRLLTDETRWRLLQALRTSDRQVNELVERSGLPQNLVSYHLGVLRQAGVDIGHQHAKHVDALAQLRPDVVVTGPAAARRCSR